MPRTPLPPGLIASAANYLNRRADGTCMGLDITTFSLDWIKHAFLLLVAVVILFLIVKGASGDAFWMRYQAKDIGLLLDASHAARGDLAIDYPLGPKDAFDYSATRTALLLRQTGHSDWRVRQRYGATNGGPNVVAALLLNPGGLHITKHGDTINLSADAAVLPGCPQPRDAPPRDAVVLKIVGDSPLVPGVKAALAPRKPDQLPQLTLTVELTASTAPPIKLAAEGDPALLDPLVCTLAHELGPFPVETSATTAGKAPAAGKTAAGKTLTAGKTAAGKHTDQALLHLTLPAMPGLNKEKLTAALLKMLEDFP